MNTGAPTQAIEGSRLNTTTPEYDQTRTTEAGSASGAIGVASSPTILESTPTATRIEPTATPDLIAVYVSGAVQHPGVYTLPVGSRVAEALGAAGGADDNANLDGINLAARLSDEEHVLVPSIGDTPVPIPPRATRTAQARRTLPSASVPSASRRPSATPRSGTPPLQKEPTPSGKININTASAAELEALPGIGPALAARIVAYRNANGLFQTPEDLDPVYANAPLRVPLSLELSMAT